MKKYILVASLAVFGLLAINTASAAPACETGSHYEGSYVESQVCNRVCARTIWGVCVRYENRCQTVGEWVGSCVADPVVEPIVEEPVAEEPVIEPTPEPVIEEPIVEPTPEPVVEEPTPEPAPIVQQMPAYTFYQAFSTGRLDDFTGEEYKGFWLYGKVAFLTTFKGLGCVQCGAIAYCEQTPSVYHIIDLNGYRGPITPFVVNGNKQVKGFTRNIE